jgi:hypothetical protein
MKEVNRQRIPMAFVYTCVFSDEQAREGLSLDAQTWQWRALPRTSASACRWWSAPVPWVRQKAEAGRGEPGNRLIQTSIHWYVGPRGSTEHKGSRFVDLPRKSGAICRAPHRLAAAGTKRPCCSAPASYERNLLCQRAPGRRRTDGGRQTIA